LDQFTGSAEAYRPGCRAQAVIHHGAVGIRDAIGDDSSVAPDFIQNLCVIFSALGCLLFDRSDNRPRYLIEIELQRRNLEISSDI
jgi:hypothetical protein